jgi:WD40 repeat protein
MRPTAAAVVFGTGGQVDQDRQCPPRRPLKTASVELRSFAIFDWRTTMSCVYFTGGLAFNLYFVSLMVALVTYPGDQKESQEVILEASPGIVETVAFHPGGKVLATGGVDSEGGAVLILWDLEKKEILKRLRGHQRCVTEVRFSIDGNFLLSTSYDGTIKIWDSKEGNELKTLTGHAGWVLTGDISRDGKLVVSGGEDKSVRVWDWRLGKQIEELGGHKDWVNCVRFRDKEIIASGSDDETVRIWNLATKGGRSNVLKCGAIVESVDYTPNGEKLIVGMKTGDVSVRAASSLKEERIIRTGLRYLKTVRFVGEGMRFGVGGGISGDDGKGKGIVRMFDARSGQRLSDLQGHELPVLSIDFSAKGKSVAGVSHSRGRSLIVWKAEASR